MKDSGKTEPDSGDRLLDVAIGAAFGPPPKAKSGTGSTLSVLRTVGQTQKVPSVLLRDIEPDHTAFVPTEVRGTAGYPPQIDRYHVIGEIARGGMGTILRARDLDLGREVVLKVLVEKYRGNPEMTHRFLEEAQITGQLQHPGIVPILEIGLYDVDQPYLAMKYVRGRTLADCLESRVTPAVERPHFLSIFVQICQTMAYAHAKGVIHRDLKPSNVMVGSFGEVQIMDWGLAKVLTKEGVAGDERSSRDLSNDPGISTWRSDDVGSDSLAGSIMGTPAYMPPEQANGKVQSIDERSDVFGLGAILCEILTGRPPYRGESAEEVYRKAKEGNLGDAMTRLDTCGADDELVELARSCLREDARERPRNAVVVAEKMRAYLESLEARARQFELRSAKARLRLSVAVFAILGLIVVGGGYVLLEGAREKQERMVLAAAEEARVETERLTARAMAGGGLPAWEAALREAGRAQELADRCADVRIRERVTQLRGAVEARSEDQRTLAQLERLKEDRGSQADRQLREFQEVFSRLGVDLRTVSIQDAARILRGSPIKPSLVPALDQWGALQNAGTLKEKLFDLAQALDDDPWRKRLRYAALKRDPVELSRLANEMEVREPDSSTFELLARALDPGYGFAGWKRSAKSAETAERLWRRAQEIHPDDFWINVRLAKFLRAEQAYDEALQYCRIAVALRPDSGYARYELGSVLAAKGNVAGAVGELRRSLLLDPDSPTGDVYYEALNILETHAGEVPREGIESLVETLRSIRVSGNRYCFDGLVQLLAYCQVATGSAKDAIATLEESARQRGNPAVSGIPSRTRQSRGDQLGDYRRRLLPDLVSYASIDAMLDDGFRKESPDEQIEQFRKLHAGRDEDAVSRLDYLEGRLLERDKRLPEAISRFRQVVARDRTLPEPYLHLARCLRSSGVAHDAESTLREALNSLSTDCSALWELWIEIGFTDLRWSAPAFVAALPAIPEPARGGGGSYRQDFQWLLDRLVAGQPILINCGGEDYQAPGSGARWGRDRFFTWESGTYMGEGSFLGRVYFGEIAGTDDDPLYQTERWFPANAGQATGYRIPLPRGTYQVVLHFAEIFERSKEPGWATRAFGIRVEGQTVCERYVPVQRGFATASQLTVEMAVEDGFLDVDFVPLPKSECPKISAIAVTALK